MYAVLQKNFDKGIGYLIWDWVRFGDGWKWHEITSVGICVLFCFNTKKLKFFVMAVIPRLKEKGC